MEMLGFSFGNNKFASHTVFLQYSNILDTPNLLQIINISVLEVLTCIYHSIYSIVY